MSKESYGTITLTDIEDTNLLGGHFIYKSNSSGTSTPSGAGVIQTVNDNPASWGYNTWIGSNGIQLRTGETAHATLDANGLILSKGGIKADINDPNDRVYLSSEDYGTNLTIINHTTSNWREVIGSNFGVDAAGNLYANNARISGVIDALAGGTIGAFTLDSDYIQSTKDGYNMGIGNTTNWAFWAGWQSGTGAPFQVKQDGSLIAKSANITGEITATSLTINGNDYINQIPEIQNKASISAEYSVSIVTSNFTPKATGSNTLVTLTAKVSRVDGTALGTISYKWYGDNNTTILAQTASYNVPANTSYSSFTVVIE